MVEVIGYVIYSVISHYLMVLWDKSADTIKILLILFTKLMFPTWRYNISWGLNYQFIFLIELVLWHSIRFQREKRSRSWILMTPHLKWKTRCQLWGELCCIHTSSPKISWVRGRVYRAYFVASIINLSFWLTWFLDRSNGWMRFEEIVFCHLLLAIPYQETNRSSKNLNWWMKPESYIITLYNL